jgi:transposase
MKPPALPGVISLSRRTAVINQIRAFLLDRGMVFVQRPANLKAVMADILENAEADLTPQTRSLVDMQWDEWKRVEQQIEKLNLELERISAVDAGCARIRQIPGIGPIVATAIVAAIGNGACGLEALARSHFPALLRRRAIFTHRGLQAAARTKEQSQRRVRSLIPKMVSKEQPTDL